MPEIVPKITADKAPLCRETKATPCSIIVFGASGDLTQRKLITGLFELYKRQLLPDAFYVMGCARSGYTDEQFRNLTRESLEKKQTDSPELIEKFLSRLYYTAGNYDDSKFYCNIKTRLAQLDAQYNQTGSHIFYLAVPPAVFLPAIENLNTCGLALTDSSNPSRVVIEKPFGRDYNSAVELNHLVHKYFREQQIYRIDHYLAKETVQNILMFRFANSIFEPLWNRNYIDHVQITIAESLGIEHRAGYYDQAGALRDIFQNHMLQLLALIAMEPPTSFEADRIRDEKTKLFRSIRPFSSMDSQVVSGQYTAGTGDSHEILAYRNEQGINPDSKTETYMAAKLLIDNWRWRNVPFYLRTGKRMKRQISEIAITFRQVPHSMFESSGITNLDPNVLVFEIQPLEGIALSFQAKVPGGKTCISTLGMAFTYRDIFHIELPDAYQRLLLDCMQGDQTLFTRYDDVEMAWKLLTPVLDYWRENQIAPYPYGAGEESFAQADELIEADGRHWRPIRQI